MFLFITLVSNLYKRKKIVKQNILEHLDLFKIKYKVIKDSILMFLSNSTSSTTSSTSSISPRNPVGLYVSKHLNIKNASVHILKDTWEVRFKSFELKVKLGENSGNRNHDTFKVIRK